jgi:hypothetical protein
MEFQIANPEQYTKGLAISVIGPKENFFEVAEAFQDAGASYESMNRISDKFRMTGRYDGFLSNKMLEPMALLLLKISLKVAGAELRVARTPSPEYKRFAELVDWPYYGESAEEYRKRHSGPSVCHIIIMDL